MALSERVTINPDHIKDGDGTVRRALELWSCRYGPVGYNLWQSAYFALIRDHAINDVEAAPGESQQVKHQRIRAMFNEIQEAIHGPDYLAQAVLQKDKRARLEQVEGQALGTAAEDRIVPVIAQQQGRYTATLLSGNPVQYQMHTPRGGENVPDPESPDRLLSRPEVEALWETATHTEATEEQDERHQGLAAKVSQVVGAETTGIQFIIEVDQLLPDYRALYGEWVQEDYESRSVITLTQFALEKLTELTGEIFEQEYELKKHVYALGKLAGRTAGQNRELAKTLWLSSRKTTPIKPVTETGSAVGAVAASSPTVPVAKSTPGLATPAGASANDLVNVVDSVTAAMSRTMDNVTTKFTEALAAQTKSDTDDNATEKFHAITGVDTKRSMPHIKDTDPDLDSYDRAFDSAVACMSFGSRKARPVDILYWYGNGFTEGSTRRKVYDNAMR